MGQGADPCPIVCLQGMNAGDMPVSAQTLAGLLIGQHCIGASHLILMPSCATLGSEDGL